MVAKQHRLATKVYTSYEGRGFEARVGARPPQWVLERQKVYIRLIEPMEAEEKAMRIAIQEAFRQAKANISRRVGLLTFEVFRGDHWCGDGTALLKKPIRRSSCTEHNQLFDEGNNDHRRTNEQGPSSYTRLKLDSLITVAEQAPEHSGSFSIVRGGSR